MYNSLTRILLLVLSGEREMGDSKLDFAGEPVGRLFRLMLFPTVAGMLSIVILNVTDGAFVGHGVGSDGLASVNIAAPIFTFITGLGLMFGSGCSVLASVHLSSGNVRAAGANVTHVVLAALIASLLLSGLILTNLEGTARLFGSNEELLSDVCSYIKWIVIFLPLNLLGIVGEFVIRLDGSPRYAMFCTIFAAGLNIFLDWLFIFPFGWGVEGAAMATGISFAASGILSLVYLLFLSGSLHFCAPSGFREAVSNVCAQMRLGFSSLLAEAAVSCSVIVGNIVFMDWLGSAGVAAYSVACYCIPTAFMLANAIAQSSQPIISFAYAEGNLVRQKQARNIAVMAGLIAGLAGFAVLCFLAEPITSVFLAEDEAGYRLCVAGLPFFSAASVFICLNVVTIGYIQSIEQAGKATFYTLLRGFIFVIPSYLFLPKILGVKGIWLALPVAEMLTGMLILVNYAVGKCRDMHR